MHNFEKQKFEDFLWTGIPGDRQRVDTVRDESGGLGSQRPFHIERFRVFRPPAAILRRHLPMGRRQLYARLAHWLGQTVSQHHLQIRFSSSPARRHFVFGSGGGGSGGGRTRRPSINRYRRFIFSLRLNPCLPPPLPFKSKEGLLWLALISKTKTNAIKTPKQWEHNPVMDQRFRPSKFD